MPGIDWNAAILYARLVAIAESVAPADEYSQANIGAIQQLVLRFPNNISID